MIFGMDFPLEVDGIKIDPDNREFQYALEFALQSNRNLYLTGKAGSGKTTFLKYLRSVTNKNMVVLAPTGVAAINAGGQTIHSFFQIPPSLYVPGDKRLRTSAPKDDKEQSTIFDVFRYKKEKQMAIRSLELLVIDEISMVRADLLDVVDTLLRVYRHDYRPFGGVQVIFIGDTFQLPPVTTGNDKAILSMFYKSEFFFSAKAFESGLPLYIELKKIYRQNELDFIDLLNRVRVNNMLPNDFKMLNKHLAPDFSPAPSDNYIILATTNATVSDINTSKLNGLDTPLKTYLADVQGDFPEKIRPTDTELHLRVGAQVMFLRNDREKRYYNGKIGRVTALDENNVKVVIDNGAGESNVITVEREVWNNIVYEWDEDEKCIVETVIGSFIQYPLRLAWAITVHKSQGLTFEKVIADIGDSFAAGQVYVALSRCTSLNGLILHSPITPQSVITDRRVIEFAKNETPETLLTEQLKGSKADYYYGEARKAFKEKKSSLTFDNFLTAIKYRNDLSTETFRRYIIIWLERLFSAAESIKELTDEIREQVAIIKEQKDQISSQKKSIDSATRRKKSDAEKIDSLKNEIGELNKRLSEVSDKVTKRDEEISRLNQTIKEKEAEIVRQASIKWHQKLFGKK